MNDEIDWATQSGVTDPGPAAAAIDELPAALAALREASSQLVFHYRAGGNFAENGVPAKRVGEINTRYADAMLALAHNAIHDLAALNKSEMLLWDAWGMQLGHGPGPVPAADAAVLDEVCADTADPGVSPATVAALGGRDGLRVPRTVTSFDPGGGPPREVTLRP
jgi:hypothetical protein